MPPTLSRDASWALLTEWVESESLRRHCRCVSLCMDAAAQQRGLPAEQQELWAVTGLLHDMDYERFPDMDTDTGHPRTALRVLEELDAPPEMVRAVASHADFMGVSRESDLEKTLYAVDELSGFVVAVAAVRPEGLRGMTPKSVKKKLKTPAFAAAVNRDDIRAGAEGLGVELDAHIAFVIGALEPHASELGLAGSATA